MGLFSAFFRKDPADLVKKGEKLLREHRFAEAKGIFEDAAELQADEPTRQAAAAGIIASRNGLAQLNITEAEHCLQAGDGAKAADHLDLALMLGEDVAIREKAEKLKRDAAFATATTTRVEERRGSHGCRDCSPAKHEMPEETSSPDDDLDDATRFELMVHALPGDLPQRYVSLGKEFAAAFLVARSGDHDSAVSAFRKLLQQGENDIVLYEAGLLVHKLGNAAECETLLRRARGANRSNALVPLALVDLLLETRRIDEAAVLLRQMIADEQMAEHASILLGEILAHQGDEDSALEMFRPLLKGGYAKEAAGRIVPILEKQNRLQEAAAVKKQYLKGCC